jgi:predicted RNase H-like HicB family nuclease
MAGFCDAYAQARARAREAVTLHTVDAGDDGDGIPP